MAKHRARVGEWGGDTIGTMAATAIKLRGNVPLEDIEELLTALQQREVDTETTLAQLVINNASKQQIEKQRQYLIKLDGGIDTLIALIDGLDQFKTLPKPQ